MIKNIKVDDLRRAVRFAAKSADSRAMMPQLRCAWLSWSADGLRIRTTNAYQWADITVSGECETAGGAAVYCGILSDILSTAKNATVDLSFSGNRLKLDFGGCAYELCGQTIDESAHLNEFEAKAVCEFEAKEFISKIRNAHRAAPKRDPRKVLMGVCFESINQNIALVATCGRVLAKEELTALSSTNDAFGIIPSDAIRQLSLMSNLEGKLTLKMGDRLCSFDVGGAKLTSLLIEGTYPKWRSVIPHQTESQFNFFRQPMIETLARAEVLAEMRHQSAIFTLSDGMAEVKAAQYENGNFTERIPVDYAGDEFRFAINTKYLARAIKPMRTAKVAALLKSAKDPIVFHEQDGDKDRSMVLVMPVRMTDLDEQEEAEIKKFAGAKA